MTHTLMICDEELFYAEKMASYINGTNDYMFEARYCSSLKDVEQYLNDNDIDILLVTNKLEGEAKKLLPSDRILILNGKEGETSKSGVYKYQNCENIMRIILQKAAGIKEIGGMVTRKNPMKIIGLYSPVKRSFQSSLAITLGQLYGLSGRSLYVNLEGYSSITELTDVEFERDMSDILYDMDNGTGNIAAIVGGAVKNFGSVNLLPPMRSSRDLRSIDYTEWKTFFSSLEIGTDFEFVILDISDGVENPLDIIDLCDYLLVASDNDKLAKNRVEVFIKDLENGSEKGNRLQKKTFVVPRIEDINARFLRTPGNPIWEYAKAELMLNKNE